MARTAVRRYHGACPLNARLGNPQVEILSCHAADTRVLHTLFDDGRVFPFGWTADDKHAVAFVGHNTVGQLNVVFLGPMLGTTERPAGVQHHDPVRTVESQFVPDAGRDDTASSSRRDCGGHPV